MDLLVLPECYFGGMPKTDHDARAQAIPAPYLPLVGASTGSHPTTVIADRLYSSAAFIRAGRVSAVPRKLFPIEPVFTPGESLSPYPAAGTQVGVVICHDANFNEPARLLAHAGARVLACPLNNDLRPKVAAEWATRTRSNLIARAVENDCRVIAADVCGRTTARVGLGATAIVGPDGRVIAQADPTREHLLVVDIDIAANSMLSRWDVRRNPECSTCGSEPRPIDLADSVRQHDWVSAARLLPGLCRTHLARSLTLPIVRSDDPRPSW